MPTSVSWSDAARWGGVLFLGITACARGEPDPPVPDPASVAAVTGPVVTSVEPATGWAGADYPIRATLRGTGFMPTGNVVTFGAIQITDLPSTDGGTRIVFSVPKQRQAMGEAPPMILQPGEYEVTVTTGDGTSEPILFTLTSAGGDAHE